MIKAQYTIGDILLEKIDELEEGNREIAESIQKLMYYVIVIGALNGTVTVGKIVEQVTENPVQEKTSEVVQSVREYNGPIDSREKRPSQSQPVN